MNYAITKAKPHPLATLHTERGCSELCQGCPATIPHGAKRLIVRIPMVGGGSMETHYCNARCRARVVDVPKTTRKRVVV